MSLNKKEKELISAILNHEYIGIEKLLKGSFFVRGVSTLKMFSHDDIGYDSKKHSFRPFSFIDLAIQSESIYMIEMFLNEKPKLSDELVALSLKSLIKQYHYGIKEKGNVEGYKDFLEKTFKLITEKLKSPEQFFSDVQKNIFIIEAILETKNTNLLKEMLKFSKGESGVIPPNVQKTVIRYCMSHTLWDSFAMVMDEINSNPHQDDLSQAYVHWPDLFNKVPPKDQFLWAEKLLLAKASIHDAQRSDMPVIYNDLRERINLIPAYLDGFNINPLGGNLELLQLWIKEGVNLNRKWGLHQLTPLMMTVNIKDPRAGAACAKTMIEHKADINAQNASKKTALMIAVQERNAELLKVLVQAGADQDIKDDAGFSFNDLRNSKGREYQSVRGWINQSLSRATPSPKVDREGLKLDTLLNGSGKGNEKAESHQISEMHAIGEVGDDKANKVQMEWASGSLMDLLKHIKASERQPETPDEFNASKVRAPMSPIHKEFRLNQMQLLVKAGESINQIDELGDSPLHLAADLTELDFIKKCIELDSHINVQNKKGESPLMRAVNAYQNEKDLESIIYLLEQGSNIYLKDHEGRIFTDYLERDFKIIDTAEASSGRLTGQLNEKGQPFKWMTKKEVTLLAEAQFEGQIKINKKIAEHFNPKVKSMASTEPLESEAIIKNHAAETGSSINLQDQKKSQKEVEQNQSPVDKFNSLVNHKEGIWAKLLMPSEVESDLILTEAEVPEHVSRRRIAHSGQ